MVVLSPLTWNHYSLVGLVGIGIAVAATGVGDRWLWPMPVLALAAVPLTMADPIATGMPLVRLALVAAMLGAILVVAWVGSRRPTVDRAAPVAAVAATRREST